MICAYKHTHIQNTGLLLSAAEKACSSHVLCTYRQIKTLIALHILKLVLIWFSCLKLPPTCIPRRHTLTRTHTQIFMAKIIGKC